MPIPFKCPHCRATGQAPDKYAGRITHCPKCKGQVTVSAPTAPPVESSTKLIAAVTVVVVTVLAGVAYTFLAPDQSEPVAAVEPAPPVEPVKPVEPAPPAKPFEYKITSEEWHESVSGKAVTVEAQVADAIAPTVTKADLESLVPIFMEKYKGAAGFGIYFHTKTPLAQAWGTIYYAPDNTVSGPIDCDIHEYAFEFGPWYFPEKIDRNTEWHELVWLTLPMVNKIVNGATQFEWEVTNRSANEVYFDATQRQLGALKDDMRLSPQVWEISTYDGDGPRFVRLVESSLNHLDHDFAQRIVGKLNSVIGSQEFLSGDKTFWTWMIDRLEVTYHHYDSSDTITIMQTKP